jgi:Rps23 Pro-64 3,4-dihydroxylase Tpa1-like proline 4-hydroxylase
MTAPPPLRAFEEPAPHHVIRGFLGPELVDALLAHAEASQDVFSSTKVGRQNDGRTDQNIRVSRVLRDLGPLREELEARFRAVMDRAVVALRLSLFELARMEIELVAHGDGAFYKRHIDTHTGSADASTDRVLTGVSYFHALPKGYDGGELRLHSILPADQGGRFVDIAPERDMLLLFPSWAPHEVRPVSCPSGAFMASRFAINCWYRSGRSR